MGSKQSSASRSFRASSYSQGDKVMVEYKDWKIEKDYKVSDIPQKRKEVEPYWWYNSVRVNRSYALGEFKLTDKQLDSLTKKHGRSALKHIGGLPTKVRARKGTFTPTKFVAKEVTHNKVRYNSKNEMALAIELKTGVSYTTVLARYTSGDRGSCLERAIGQPSKKGKKYKKQPARFGVVATKGNEREEFDSVIDCAEFFAATNQQIYGAMRAEKEFRGWELVKVRRAL